MSLLTLYHSPVVKKAVMAVTGIILYGFVLGHMIGNLKAFQGAEVFNHYAEYLRVIGYPLVPKKSLLFLARGGLIVAVLLHIWSGVTLALLNKRARGGTGYKKRRGLQLDFASRTMFWSGLVLLAYIVFHLGHMTIGNVHPDFIEGEAYHNLTTGLASVPAALFYAVAAVLLGFHLYHGLWSLFQTLGLDHPAIKPLRRPFAVIFAVLISLGFLTVPLSVLAGFIS